MNNKFLSIALIAGLLIVASSCNKSEPEPQFSTIEPITVSEPVDRFTVIPADKWSDYVAQADPLVFYMGTNVDPKLSLDQTPAHKVAMDYSFAMSSTEVTVEQYQKFLAANPNVAKPKEPFWGWTLDGVARQNMPITGVTWAEADAFARWIGGRLPTEAEWEFMARSGRGVVVKSSATAPTIAGTVNNSMVYINEKGANASKTNVELNVWYFKSSTDLVKVVYRNGQRVEMRGMMPHAVAAKRPDFKFTNGGTEYTGTCLPYTQPLTIGGVQYKWGLADMQGNVMEWCSDWFSPTVYQECLDEATAGDGFSYNPKGPEQGKYKSLRGGSWYQPEFNCTIYARQRLLPDTRSEEIGFRVVFDLVD